MSRYLFLVSLSVLAGCTTIENTLVGPPAQIEPVLPEIPVEWVSAGVYGDIDQGDWISQFDDSVLSAIVDEAVTNNPDIRASEATARAANENARAVYGRSLPSVTYSTQQSYATTFSARTVGGGLVASGRFSQPTYDQRFNFDWELDVWGRVRAANQAARADFYASEADLAGARLSLAGQAAIAWIELNAAMEQERVARETYTARKRTLDLTERRFESGLSTALDVRTARTQLATSEVQIAAQEQARSNAARRLETLLGRYPAAEIDGPSTLPELGTLPILGNPTLLLARRPDIVASEARLEAAGLRAEQARLAILPAFRATGSVSNNSSVEFSDIFDPEQISANIAGALSQTVWAGGSLRADKRAAIAQAEAAAANYTSTVLNAWFEVEDAIASDAHLRVQLEAQQRALDESVLAERLGERQYLNGLISIFNLINLQTTRLANEAQLITFRSNRATNRVRYHMALGGAWLGEEPSQTAATQTNGKSS